MGKTVLENKSKKELAENYNKITFTNFKGFIYIEKYNSDIERLEILDQNGHYLDYYSNLDGEKEDYDNFCSQFANVKNEFDAFEWFCQSYDYGKTPKQTLEQYMTCDGKLEPIEEIMTDIANLSNIELCEKHDINYIGEYYFKGDW